tara:strand:- start:1675 stop:2496 length:822 start_codon:yes stop_codon:yes gene_type:complete
MAKKNFEWYQQFTEREMIPLETSPSHGNLTFLYPCYGPKRYDVIHDAAQNVGGVRISTFEETSFILSSLAKEHSSEIRELMRERWLWTSTGLLPSQNGKGVYIQDRTKVHGPLGSGRPHMDESELTKRLKLEDSEVRFVPFGYKTKNMKRDEFLENELIVRAATKPAAERLVGFIGRSRKDVYIRDTHIGPYDNGHVITLHSPNNHTYNRFEIDPSNGNMYGCAFLVPTEECHRENLTIKSEEFKAYMKNKEAESEAILKKWTESQKEGEGFF